MDIHDLHALGERRRSIRGYDETREFPTRRCGRFWTFRMGWHVPLWLT